MKNITKFLGAMVILSLMAFTASRPTLLVSSSAFENKGMIPAKYSSNGQDINPPLNISNIPLDTRSFAIILHDPDAPKSGGVYHWVAWNLPADGNIPEDFKGGSEGLNSDNKTGYKGMNPNEGTHHYDFTIYALDTTLTLPATTDYAELEEAIKKHVLAKGELTGLYTKSK